LNNLFYYKIGCNCPLLQNASAKIAVNSASYFLGNKKLTSPYKIFRLKLIFFWLLFKKMYTKQSKSFLLEENLNPEVNNTSMKNVRRNGRKVKGTVSQKSCQDEGMEH
jgi:hypothetical protein